MADERVNGSDVDAAGNLADDQTLTPHGTQSAPYYRVPDCYEPAGAGIAREFILGSLSSAHGHLLVFALIAF